MKLYHRKCMLKRKDRIIGTLLEIVNLFHHFQSITLKASGLGNLTRKFTAAHRLQKLTLQ